MNCELHTKSSPDCFHCWRKFREWDEEVTKAIDEMEQNAAWVQPLMKKFYEGLEKAPHNAVIGKVEEMSGALGISYARFYALEKRLVAQKIITKSRAGSKGTLYALVTPSEEKTKADLLSRVAYLEGQLAKPAAKRTKKAKAERTPTPETEVERLKELVRTLTIERDNARIAVMRCFGPNDPVTRTKHP